MKDPPGANAAARGPGQGEGTGHPLLEMRGISKAFPGVLALRGVSLRLDAGEVLALVGENGAGKSTLVRVLAGAHLPDEGEILIDGLPAGIFRPRDAIRAGIGFVSQEFSLVPALTASENIFLGREPGRLGFIARRDELRRARKLFERIGVRIDPAAPCRELAIAQQQVVEIAKALSRRARILVLDEPTAALTPQEVDRLFAVVRDLRRQGIGIIAISHRLDEVFSIADRVMVLRDGLHVATRPVGNVTREGLIELMVGRPLDQEFPKRPAPLGEVLLSVRELRRGLGVRGVSFDLRRGEILALTGLVGAGRTETARAIFGADIPDAGTVALRGKAVSIRSPRDAIQRGICLLTEDRKLQGLVLGLSVRENFSLPSLRDLSRFGFLRARAESVAFRKLADRLRIRVPSPESPARNLSGGNQQKLVLAKWLQRNAEVVIFDEPTRGIDVGAKVDIYLLMNELAAAGKGILMISSELPEVLGMADRILVMHEGRITGEIRDPRSATQEEILELAIG